MLADFNPPPIKTEELPNICPLYVIVDTGTGSQFDREPKLSEEKCNLLGLRKFRIFAGHLIQRFRESFGHDKPLVFLVLRPAYLALSLR